MFINMSYMFVNMCFFCRSVTSARTVCDDATIDFLSYFDLSLTRVWDAVEAEEFSQLRANGLIGSHVHHLRLVDLVNACPGIRCDGIHFGSSSPELGCYSSTALIDGFLAGELHENFLFFVPLS